MIDFEITGPDGDGFVWLHIGNDTINLGKVEDVAERLSQWLGSIDYQEDV